MTQKRRSPYIWVTWLTKLLVGEQSCEWMSWFKAHFTKFDKVPSDFDLAQWTMNHTRMSRDLRVRLKAEGAEVFVEDQNSFRFPYNGALLSGKADLVAHMPDGTICVYDVKTGQERASNQIQVLLYMYLLPLCHERYAGKMFTGCVYHGQDKQIPIDVSAVDQSFIDNVEFYLDILVAENAPDAMPSKSECRFCDITKTDCLVRA